MVSSYNHRRASSPFRDLPDDDDRFAISHTPSSPIRPNSDVSSEFVSFSEAFDEEQSTYKPMLDLADQMMRAAFFQASAEASSSQSTYSNGTVKVKSPQPASSIDRWMKSEEPEAIVEDVASEYIRDCCTPVDNFDDFDEESVAAIIPAYQQQRSRSSTLVASSDGSVGEVNQLFAFNEDWPFESYDDALEGTSEFDNCDDLSITTGLLATRVITHGPMYPILGFRRQLSVSATWVSDADLFLETAQISAERQAQAMMNKAFESSASPKAHLTADRVVDFAYQSKKPRNLIDVDLDKPLPALPSAHNRHTPVTGASTSIKTECRKAMSHFGRSIANAVRKKIDRAVKIGKKKAYFIPH